MKSNRPRRRKPIPLSQSKQFLKRKSRAQTTALPAPSSAPPSIPTSTDESGKSLSTKESAETSPKSVHSEILQNKPAPPTKPAPDAQKVAPLRWRPNAPSNNNIASRIQRGRQKLNRGSSRMSQTARRMLGLMSVMMAGRAQGVTTGVYSKQMNDIQTGLDGNILLKPGTNIAVRTVGRSRLSKLGCICPCKCSALPRHVGNGRVFVKNKDVQNAPAYLRDFLIQQRSFMDCLSNCDVVQQWTVAENLLSGIFAYVCITPTEYTWKLKLKRRKFEKKYEASNGEMAMPETDKELSDMISTDEEMDNDQPWKSPELLQAELCICLCSCNGAPLVKAPSFPVMKYAVGYKKKAAKIYFDHPLNDGGSDMTGFQVTSMPGNIIKTGMKSPIKIKGLNIGVWYRFVVRARNRRGLGPPSVPSNPIRISEPIYATELQNALEMADSLNELNRNNKNTFVDTRKSREISQKTIIELENEDLSNIIEKYKGKHKLNSFSLLRPEQDFFKHKIFGRTDNMLSFQTRMIPKSLLVINRDNIDNVSYVKQLQKLSLDIFDDILIFQNLKPKQNKIDAAQNIIELGKHHSLLRDEIYAQIMKQITDIHSGDDGIELILGLKLLYLCLVSFRSSKEMSLIILSKVCEYITHKDRDQSNFASFRNANEIAINCFKQWKLSNANNNSDSDSIHYISETEISQILYSKSAPIRLEIYLCDNTRLRIKIDPFCTMRELTNMVCDRFGLSAFYECMTLKIIANIEKFTTETNTNSFRDNTEVAHWYGRWKDIIKKHPLLRYKIILFKWKYDTRMDTAVSIKNMSEKYIHCLYSQCKLMVCNGQIPIGGNDCSFLASLSLLIQSKGSLIARHEIDQDLIIELIPHSLREKIEFNELKHQIFDTMKVLGSQTTNNTDRNESMVLSKVIAFETQYIQYLAINVEMYGCSFFNVKVRQPKELMCAENEGLLIGMNWNTVFICKDQKTVLAKYALRSITDVECVEDMKQITFNVNDGGSSENELFGVKIETEFVGVISALLGKRISDEIK